MLSIIQDVGSVLSNRDIMVFVGLLIWIKLLSHQSWTFTISTLAVYSLLSVYGQYIARTSVINTTETGRRAGT